MEKKPSTENVINLELKIGAISCTLISVLPFQNYTAIRRRYYEHHHHHFEVHIVKNGECTFLCNNHPITVDNTKILLMPLQIYHKEIHSSNDCERMTLSFNLKLSQDCNDQESVFYFESFQRLHKAIKIDYTQMLKDRLSVISSLAGVDDRSFLEQEKLRAACHHVLIELFDAVADKEQLVSADRQTPALPLEYTIDNFFAQNYMNSSGKQELAELLHVSTRQLHRILMDHYGKNYREKFNEARIQVAAGFLMDTDISIAEISEQMGYSSPENFATFIKNETGKTPGQIRREGFPTAINKKVR